MKKVKRRILSVMLIAAMVMGLFPMTVLAAGEAVAQVGGQQYDSLQAAVDAAEANNGTVELLRDVVLDGTGKGDGEALLVIDGTLTLDGNGFVISAENVDLTRSDINEISAPDMIHVENGASVTFEDLSIDGGEAINEYEATPKAKAIIVADGSSVTFNDVELINSSDQYNLVSKGATIVANGLKTDAPDGLLIDNGSNLTINDGSIGSICFTKTDPEGEKSKAVINGGYIANFRSSGLGEGGDATDTDLKIVRGFFGGYDYDGKTGTINLGAEEYKSFFPTGTELKKVVYNDNGYEGFNYQAVADGDKMVAAINGTEYATLQEAIYAAKDGETIELLGDLAFSWGDFNGLISMSGDHSTIKNKNIVIDGKQHTISSKYAYNHDLDLLSVSSYSDKVSLALKDIVFDGSVDGKTLLKGLSISDANLTLDNVTVKNVIGNGVDLRSTTAQLTDVTITDSGEYAINVDANGNNLTIDGLTTSDNEWGGVQVSCSTDEAVLTINDADISDFTSVALVKSTMDDTAKIKAAIKGGSYETVYIAEPEGSEGGISLEITGGTFKSESTSGINIAEYLPAGYIFDTSSAVEGYGQVIKEGEESETPPEEEEPSEPSTPSTPSTPSGPIIPSQPDTPAGDVVTEGSATTVKPEVTVEGSVASATVDEGLGDTIVEEVVENESGTVVIAPEMDKDVTAAAVTIPAATLETIGEKTNADLVIETPVGTVTLPNGELSSLAKDDDEITISLAAKDDTLALTISDNNGEAVSIDDRVTLTVPADTTSSTVAVIVREDGTQEVVRKSVASDGSVIVPLEGAATIQVVDNSKTFVDVPEDSWYSDAVAFAASHELFNGTSVTEFSPDAGMTRGMLAAVLSNLERGDGSGLEAAFDDIADDAWYADAVAWAAEQGIVNGYGDGKFGPNDLITREQMAAMLYNYAEMLGIDTSARADLDAYSDAGDVSGWAAEVMSWANAEGLINGTSSTTLDPQGTATRAQVAAMLERFVKMLV